MVTIEGGLNERLKQKVEFTTLNDFGNNLNNKFVSDINQKLDKKDLAVKTTMLNKKVTNE